MTAAIDLIATHRCFVFPDTDTASEVYGDMMLRNETDFMGLFIDPSTKTILVGEPFGDAFTLLLDQTANLGPDVRVQQKIGDAFYDLGNGLEVLHQASQTLQYGKGADGALYLMKGAEMVLTIPADGKLGLFYAKDDVIGGTLHKHGLAERVETLYTLHCQALREVGLQELANELDYVELPVASLSAPAIAELNACLSISGRIGRITERLNALH